MKSHVGTSLPVNENIHALSLKDHMCCSEGGFGHPQRKPQCLLDKSHNFPDLHWAGPLKENAGRHLATGFSHTLRRTAMLVLAVGDRLLPPCFMNCHSSLFDPPRVSCMPKSLLHIITLFQIIARENAKVGNGQGREITLCTVYRVHITYSERLRSGGFAYFCCTKAIKRRGKKRTEIDTSGTRARHDLLTFLPDLKLLI